MLHLTIDLTGSDPEELAICLRHTNVQRVPIGTPVTISGVLASDGSTGRIIGRTHMRPSWPVVQLDDGRRVVVRPGHLIERKEPTP